MREEKRAILISWSILSIFLKEWKKPRHGGADERTERFTLLLTHAIRGGARRESASGGVWMRLLTHGALGLGGEGAHGGGDLGELRRGGDKGGHGVEVTIEGAQPHAALDEKVLCGGHIDGLL